MERGQVWLETVIYTLVGLALIGLVLGIITPRINDYRDRAVVEQTISVLNNIDAVINAISSDPGNARVIDIQLKKGVIIVDAVNDSISFVLEDSSTLYSEPGVLTMIGNIEVLTEEFGNDKRVQLMLRYANESNISMVNGQQVRTFMPSSIPYRFRFENKGINATAPNPLFVIEFREISGG